MNHETLPAQGPVDVNVSRLLAEYSAELGVEISVPMLIESHRRLREELEAGSRAEFRQNLQMARDAVTQLTMDVTWVKIDALRAMTVQELVQLVGEE